MLVPILNFMFFLTIFDKYSVCIYVCCTHTDQCCFFGSIVGSNCNKNITNCWLDVTKIFSNIFIVGKIFIIENGMSFLHSIVTDDKYNVLEIKPYFIIIISYLFSFSILSSVFIGLNITFIICFKLLRISTLNEQTLVQ